jgi:predicted DNA binding CopG/RHH family protein
MNKKVTFGGKPTAKAIEPDQWVENRITEKTKRLTFDISDSLHRRIKSQCAIKGVKMADEIRELLEKNFQNIN